MTWLAVIVTVGVLSALWLAAKASVINKELTAAIQLVPYLREEITSNDTNGAAATADKLRVHTTTAKDAAADPLWVLASTVPVVGVNFGAVSEVARSADDVTTLGLGPLIDAYSSLDWGSLVPTSEGSNLEPLKRAAPSVSAAAYAVRASAERLDTIDASGLLPQVAVPVKAAREQLQSVTGTLDASANAAELLPSMLGADAPRNYLLMIQNNAESRASGGIPGALAIVNVTSGKLTLSAQSSAGDVGVMAPVINVDSEQQQIYSSRLGKFMQDVNLTPDFPSAASTAQAMWERKSGQRVDGVISVDPVALSYVLDATGSVTLTTPELTAIAGSVLPRELNSDNVVQTLLSDVYAKVAEPALQDVYFAGVAKEIFTSLSQGKGNERGLVEAFIRGTNEGRVLVWSADSREQSTIAKYRLSGSVGGPSISPSEFSVFFNDGTGAKMDFYVRRTVQLVKECSVDGYEQTTVRVSSTNTAPADAATSLPAYVTGDGNFGVPPGSVQTNLTVYGPVQALVETAKINGVRTEFASYVHASRPVGIVAVRLAPGETQTLEFTFGKIVQHTEPNLLVTPTVQDVKDVTLPTVTAPCS